jgi:hypothetical protein
MKISKTVCMLLIALVFSSCAPKSEMPERIVEDGVEVVLNRLEPYTLKGEPATFTIRKEFAIDTEDDETAELGLTDIGVYFDVDSEGNIFLNSYQNAEGMIFQFDKEGQFVRSFGGKGQGPGELQGLNYLSLCITVDREDNIAVSDFGNKLAFFGREGELIAENRIDSETIRIVPLSNGCFASFRRVMEPAGDYINQNPLMLLDSRFEEIKVLERQMIPNPIVGKRLKGTYYVFSWSVSNGKIFTGFQERGYEILVFDFEGNLVRKIRKEHKPVPVPEEHKKKFMEQFSAALFDDIRSKIYFPEEMPPFHGFFTDDGGRLFVMTYQAGENPGEYVYDIFNPEGVCVGRKSLNIGHDVESLYAKMRDGRLYCLHEKESGYKELVVSKVIWE